ncbi:MAG: aspartate-semialdehyde dehydrogenase [Planctomycetota bacterium]
MAIEVAIVGATGAVGREMLACLEESGLEVAGLHLFASARSRGRELDFRGRRVALRVLEDLDDAALADLGLDYALFAAGGEVSRIQAPRFLAAGARVIDNSSAFRLDPGVPLVVPEVNLAAVRPEHRLIANPNCSTIIALVAIAPLHRAFGLESVVAATYQAASGAGEAGLAELDRNLAAALGGGEAPSREVFGADLALNLIPWIGAATPGGDTDEELKMRCEGRKILGAPDLAVTCTCVRVPVRRVHAIALTLGLRAEAGVEAAAEVLRAAPGLRLEGGRGPTELTTPRDLAGRDEVVVSRLREAWDGRPGLALFAMGDQIRKGAALNAVQIAVALESGGPA